MPVFKSLECLDTGKCTVSTTKNGIICLQSKVINHMMSSSRCAAVPWAMQRARQARSELFAAWQRAAFAFMTHGRCGAVRFMATCHPTFTPQPQHASKR